LGNNRDYNINKNLGEAILNIEKLDNKENKAKEKALKYEKQNYIKYLLDYSPDFQIILDGDGYFT
jgi:hypothetical protein